MGGDPPQEPGMRLALPAHPSPQGESTLGEYE